MDWLYAIVLVLGLLGLLGLLAYGLYSAYAAYVQSGRALAAKEQKKVAAVPAALGAISPAAAAGEFKISFAPSSQQWSGTSIKDLPIKVLTFRQYECLEDARYGFTVVGVNSLELQSPQPHKTRAHGKKTVASLAKHGFLAGDSERGFAITDDGLHALAVCGVRY